ncbi:adenylyl-sulfate kinase [Aureimonas psammosilenae]|uniref:adenylyl-sulfate kinase n=1 Tax=Aureimonas psammosilenae TaxID=2495496 RepID=UPI001F1E87F3|nr:adenylyl-sulfate kinase [Aureimonas psammosilenae]
MPDDQNQITTPMHRMRVTPACRAKGMGQVPLVVWLTGLSGAGKSTLADRLDIALHGRGFRTMVLDGDNLRCGLNADLGFTDAERSENVRRVAHLAALMADAGLIVLVSLISPYRRDRDRAKETVGASRFLEVFVDAPLSTCAARDPKGFYARATAGSLAMFTGIGSAYEHPEKPDIHLKTDEMDPDMAVLALVEAMMGRGIEAS